MIKALLGDHPLTQDFKLKVLSQQFPYPISFADEAVPNKAFKKLVHEEAFDIAELALVTAIQAKLSNKPYSILAIPVMGRPQQGLLMTRQDSSIQCANDLRGKVIGARSATQTSVVWLRGYLNDIKALSYSEADWQSYELPHIAPTNKTIGFREKIGQGKVLEDLLHGTIDAAILNPADTNHPLLRRVISDHDAQAKAWETRLGIQQVNHVWVVHDSLSKDQEFMTKLIKSLHKSYLKALTKNNLPWGYKAMQPSLKKIIELSNEQGLIDYSSTIEQLIYPEWSHLCQS